MSVTTLRLPPQAAAKAEPKLRSQGYDAQRAAEERKAAKKAAKAAAAAAERAARRAAEKAANIAAEKELMTRAAAERQAKREALQALLLQRYPDVFNAEAPKPLAIGVSRVIQREHGFTQPIISLVLGWWTRRWQYCEAMIAGSVRFNLDGTEAGQITEADKADAQARLAALKERLKARAKARRKRKARPAPAEASHAA
jgi:ProP effector